MKTILPPPCERSIRRAKWKPVQPPAPIMDSVVHRVERTTVRAFKAVNKPGSGLSK